WRVRRVRRRMLGPWLGTQRRTELTRREHDQRRRRHDLEHAEVEIEAATPFDHRLLPRDQQPERRNRVVQLLRRIHAALTFRAKRNDEGISHSSETAAWVRADHERFGERLAVDRETHGVDAVRDAAAAATSAAAAAAPAAPRPAAAPSAS